RRENDVVLVVAETGLPFRLELADDGTRRDAEPYRRADRIRRAEQLLAHGFADDADEPPALVMRGRELRAALERRAAHGEIVGRHTRDVDGPVIVAVHRRHGA